MQANYTHVTLLCDRSGSMEKVKTDAEAAVNGFIKRMGEGPGVCTLMLCDFDTEYRVLHRGGLNLCPTYTLEPRGWTALLDAMGRAIKETGQYLRGLDEPLRPAKVVFVVQTDGQENHSTEFNYATVRAMVEHQISHYKWEFIFLGAGLQAAEQGAKLGVQHNVMYSSTGPSTRRTYDIAAANVNSYRAGAPMAMPSTVEDDPLVTTSST